ncbi:hypothetical protein Cabys_1164 [Caldithrix abyssi DSM 13497]|uniref:Uncharacterized protein n=1 Tax=Caldithrix abyssi DSM 13497 TaxID=880073 RepID=A0A1J1C6J4_CALAY|nr:hypothetical protein Cabys_1164 [Caldithrix abyssi DSM 13497]
MTRQDENLRAGQKKTKDIFLKKRMFFKPYLSRLVEDIGT